MIQAYYHARFPPPKEETYADLIGKEVYLRLPIAPAPGRGFFSLEKATVIAPYQVVALCRSDPGIALLARPGENMPNLRAERSDLVARALESGTVLSL